MVVQMQGCHRQYVCGVDRLIDAWLRGRGHYRIERPFDLNVHNGSYIFEYE